MPATDPRTAQVIDTWSALPDRGVIFDFNGTLSDDEPLLLRIFQEMFRERLGWTLSPRHYYSRLAGRSDREIVEVLVDELGDADGPLTADLLAQRRRRYRELVDERSPIGTPTVDLALALHRAEVPLGIVTGAQRIDVEYVVSRSPLAGVFGAVVTEEDVRNGKPHPEGFLTGAAALGVDPANVLVFEDSVHGVRAAKDAGMACIAVEGTRERAVLAAVADAVVGRLGPELAGTP